MHQAQNKAHYSKSFHFIVPLLVGLKINNLKEFTKIIHPSGYEPELPKLVDSECADFWLLEDPMPVPGYKSVDHVTYWQWNYPENREPHPPFPPHV